MSKKTIISSLLQKADTPAFAAVYFRVGAIPLKADGTVCVDPDGNPVFPAVKEIKHCRDRFGTGAQIDQPCYDIHFVDSDERLIMPISKFVQATIVTIDEDPVPGLPE